MFSEITVKQLCIYNCLLYAIQPQESILPVELPRIPGCYQQTVVKGNIQPDGKSLISWQ